MLGLGGGVEVGCRVPGGLAWENVLFYRFIDFPMLPGLPEHSRLILAHEGQTVCFYFHNQSPWLSLPIAIAFPGINVSRTPLLSSPTWASEVTSILYLLKGPWLCPYQKITNFLHLPEGQPSACLPGPTPASGDIASSRQQCNPTNCLAGWPGWLAFLDPSP